MGTAYAVCEVYVTATTFTARRPVASGAAARQAGEVPQPNPGRRPNRSARRTRPAAPRTRSRRRPRQATATRRHDEAAVRRGGGTRRHNKATRRRYHDAASWQGGRPTRRRGGNDAKAQRRQAAQPRNGEIPQSSAATFDRSHPTHRAENTSPRTTHAYRSIRAKYLVTTAFTLVAFPNISFRYPNTAAPYYSPLCSTKVIASPFFQ